MRFLWLILFLALSAVPAFAEELTGEVIAVQDGDTVTLLGDANQLTKIRLAEIDAPELKQPYGNASKRMLSALVYRKDVTVVTKTIDKYGRTVGRIYEGDTDVNLTMVKQGGAWAYRKYLTDDTILAAEGHAKAAAAGIWGLQKDQRMPPWEWRHRGKPAPVTELQEGDGELEETSSSEIEAPLRQPVYIQPTRSYSQPQAATPSAGKACCKHCSKGQPCGDGCISKNKVCSKPTGCAC
jgi:endonuclease YncB( thermonuclease family)